MGNATDGRSSVEIAREIAADSNTLFRKEIELAKRELIEMLMAKVKGAITFVAAGVMVLLATVFLGATLASALSGAVAPWLADLIVAGIYLLGAAIAVLAGMTIMRKRRQPVLAETTKTIKEDVGWAKQQLKQ